MRILLDTNVLISAFLGSGLCRDLLRAIVDEQQLCVSQLIIDEYQRALRSKFGAGDADLQDALMLVQQAEVLPDVSAVDQEGPGPTNDVVILATARDAGVGLVVTGDRAMRAQALEFDLIAVSPRGCFQLMAQAEDPYPLPSEDDHGPLVSEPQINPIKEKSFAFALQIVKLYQQLQDQREYVLSKQLLRSGTSIGANVEEATAAESRADFIHKMKIAMKEARETHYWLRLLDKSNMSVDYDLGDLLPQVDEISRILTSITKTAIENSRRMKR